MCDVTLVISSREGIEIDHCPQCRGVWLDRGELDKIIERAAPAVAGASRRSDRDWEERPPPRSDDRDRDERSRDEPRREELYRDDRPYRKKRRGGFLEDLFDFD